MKFYTPIEYKFKYNAKWKYELVTNFIVGNYYEDDKLCRPNSVSVERGKQILLNTNTIMIIWHCTNSYAQHNKTIYKYLRVNEDFRSNELQT